MTRSYRPRRLIGPNPNAIKYDTCINDHVRTPMNTAHRTICLDCLRETVRAAREKARQKGSAPATVEPSECQHTPETT